MYAKYQKVEMNTSDHSPLKTIDLPHLKNDAPDTPGVFESGDGHEAHGRFENALPAGTTLVTGNYRLEEVLGQGGFGITYRGEDLRLSRRVAIKELFPAGCTRSGPTLQLAGTLSSSEFEKCRSRFLRESRLLARFNHPGIAAVYDAFEENNTAYMVMEYLDGFTLTHYLRGVGVQCTETESLEMVNQVGSALEAVHQAGLLHLDVKPDNIMVCGERGEMEAETRRFVLIDFGATKEQATVQPQRHSIILTPGYAPLEQYGQQAQRGAYTDIYALAATLYHLLAGHPPATASERAAGIMLTPQVEEIQCTDPGIRAALNTGLALDATLRPQSVREFLDILHGGIQLPPAAPRLQLSDNGSAPSSIGLSVPSSSPTSAPALTRTLPVATAEESSLRRRSRIGVAAGALAMIGASAWWIAAQYQDVTYPSMRLPQIGPRTRLGAAKSPATPPPLPLSPSISTTQLSNYESGSLARFTESGNRLVTLYSGFVSFWDVGSGKRLARRSLVKSGNYYAEPSFDGRWFAGGMTVYPRSNAFDASLLREGMAETPKTSIKLLDSISGQTVKVLKNQAAVRDVSLSPNGRLLVQDGGMGSLTLWNLDKETTLFMLPAPETVTKYPGVTALKFTADSKTLACAYSDRSIRLWDMSTGKLRVTLMGHAEDIASLAFSSDGTKLVSSDYAVARLWDVKTQQNKRLERFQGGGMGVHYVLFSPDDQRIAGATAYAPGNGTLMKVPAVWDADGEFIEACQPSQSKDVTAVTFAEGHSVLRGFSVDGAISRWNVH